MPRSRPVRGQDASTDAQDAVLAQEDRRYAVEYEGAKQLADESEKRRKNLREVVLGRIKQRGKKDEYGNIWLPAIDRLMKAERRAGQRSFDASKAEQWLKDRGWWDAAKETVPEQVIPEHDVITEQGLAAFLYRKRKDKAVPDDIPDDVYNVGDDTYALKVTQETDYDY